MNFKKFVAKDISEAYKQISEELGKDALILETRYVKQPGFLGSFKPKIVEVIAGIDQNTKQAMVHGQGPVPRRMPLQSQPLHRAPQMARPTQAYPHSTVTSESLPSYGHYQGMKERQPVKTDESVRSVVQEPLEEEVVKPTPSEVKSEGVSESAIPKKESVEATKPVTTYSKFPSKTQVEGLKTMMTATEEAGVNEAKMTALEGEMKEIRRLLTNMAMQPKTVESNTSSEELTYEEQFQVIFGDYEFSKLVQQGFKAHLIKEGIEPKAVTLSHLRDFVEQEVSRVVKIAESNPSSPIHVFVGPPGVGKTTTIAKIASNEILNHQRKVGLITVDTYRIGAVEQLKTYAELLNAPIKVVYSPSEMTEAVAELQADGCDMIIVDSIGRSHRDQGNLEDLNKLINPLETENVYLVLNMSTKHRELLKIMDKFKFMNYRQFVFTKLDESERNENILNICYETAYPVAFLCTGQEVPRDIERPTKERLMDFIWGGALNE